MKAAAPRKSLRKLKPTPKAAKKKAADSSDEFEDLDDLADQLFAEELQFEEDVGIAKCDVTPSKKKSQAKTSDAKATPPKTTAKTPEKKTKVADTVSTTIMSWSQIQTSLLVLLINGSTGIDVTERGGVSGMQLRIGRF